MPEKKKARRHLLLSGLFVLVLLAAARAVSLWYSYAATDILYMETVLPDVLFYARQILSMTAFGTGTAATVLAAFRYGKPCSFAFFGIFAALFLADHLCAFLTDVISGAIGDALIPFAAVVTAIEWVCNTLLAYLALVAVHRCLRRGKDRDHALLSASLVHLAGWLCVEIAYLIDSLIAVDFAVTPSGTVLIVGEFLRVIVLNGGVVWIAAVAFFALFSRLSDKKSEEFTKNL